MHVSPPVSPVSFEYVVSQTNRESTPASPLVPEEKGHSAIRSILRQVVCSGRTIYTTAGVKPSAYKIPTVYGKHRSCIWVSVVRFRIYVVGIIGGHRGCPGLTG